MNSSIGLVVALNAEASAIVGRGCWEHAEGCLFRRSLLSDSADLMVARSGIGPKNAAAASRRLIGKGVAALAVSGVSGGLAPRLLPGDLVIGDTVIQGNGNGWRQVWQGDDGFVGGVCAGLKAEGFSAYRGPLLTLPDPVLSAGDKETLFLKSKALAVDMESAAVAEAAVNAGIPFFVLRAVCDPAPFSISGDLSRAIDDRGRVRLFHLFQKLILRPAALSDLLRMKRDFDAALAALTRAWRLTIRKLLPSLLSPVGTSRL